MRAVRRFKSRIISVGGACGLLLVFCLASSAGAQEECPPPLGTEIVQTSASTAKLDLIIFLDELQETLELAGDVTTRAVVEQRGLVKTEILSMTLTGESPALGRVILMQNPEQPSPGQMVECRRLETPDATPYCGCDSFFDVFFEIEVEGAGLPQLKLHNERPLRVSGRTPIPLRHNRIPFEFVQSGEEVVLLDERQNEIGLVTNVTHGIIPSTPFKRGDADCNGCVDRADAQYILDWLFNNGPASCCFDAADANDDGAVSAADANYILTYVLVGAPPPPPPGPLNCGPDLTADDLGPCNYTEKLCEVECEEPGCFPPAGIDVMNSNLFHDIDVIGIGLIRGNLTGPIKVLRSDPYIDPETGLQCIDTQIVEMDLRGTDSVVGRVVISLDPCTPSLGKIREKVPGTCFPAESFFDVYVKVQLPDLDLCFYACQPAQMRTMIDRIPPIGAFYNLDIGDGDVIPLYEGPCMEVCDPAVYPCNQQPRPVPDAFIVKAVHQPLPPEECTCFPEAGDDVLITDLAHQITLFGLDITCRSFQGPIVVRRSDPYADSDGHCMIDTEIVRMAMTGVCSDGLSAIIRLNPDRPSKGFIRSENPGECYPARSCFNIFFEVEVQTPNGPMTFRNCKPAVMCCDINRLPPLGCPYALQNAPIELYRVPVGAVVDPCLVKPLPAPAGVLEEASHTPEDEAEPCCPEYGPGTDVFDSNLFHDIRIPGIGTCSANLRGPVKVLRGQSYRDPNAERCCVDVEIVEMLLEGHDPSCGPIRVTLDPRRPSRGRICELREGTCFDAESCFDMFVRIEVLEHGLVLVACVPTRLCCTISSIPPYGCLYNLDIGLDDVTPLYAEDPAVDVCSFPPSQRPEPRAFIEKAVHRPEPTCTYPEEGDDEFDSELAHRVRVFGLGPEGGDLVCEADMHGPVVVHRFPPEIDPTTGLCKIPTEITSLNLEGFDRVCGRVIIRLNPEQQSVGEIIQKESGSDFPADSFFNVFVEVEVPEHNVVLRNCAPVHMETVIERLPPFNQFYILRLGDVPLYRPDECERLPNPEIEPAGVIEAASHAPREPCDCPEYGPGTDVMDSRLAHDIELIGLGRLCQVNLTGNVVVDRGEPYAVTHPDGTVSCCVSTRMVSLELEGDDPDCGPISIRLNPDRPTRGTICAEAPGTCFPAISCFDMFIEVEVMGMVLVNCEPVEMCCTIDSIPPYECTYVMRSLANIPLFRKGECVDDPSQLPPPTAIIQEANHTPIPCGPRTIRCEVDQETNEATVTWQFDPDCPCDEILLTRTDEAGNIEVFTLPGGQTSWVEPLECPPNALGEYVYTYCVYCTTDDATSEPVCCDARLICVECEIEQVNCDPAGDDVILTWTVSRPDCCEEFIIYVDGVEDSRVPGNQRQARIPCRPGTHTYCVACVLPDGTELPIDEERHCCEVTCPCDDAQSTIEELDCEVDHDNGVVTLTWQAADPACCNGFRVTRPDGITIDIAANTITEDCKEGRWCVQCIRSDGSLGPEECCEVDCEEQVGGWQLPCDCEQDGDLLITDGICILGFLFLGAPPALPCGDGGSSHPANITVFDCDGSSSIDLTDAVYVFSFLFLGGPPPAMGRQCILVPECPDIRDSP